jgi:hypothetical protein
MSEGMHTKRGKAVQANNDGHFCLLDIIKSFI